LWKDDPKKKEYYAYRWPKSWHFYESHIKLLAPSMNEFVQEHRPDAESYGFIADDVVLRTPGGLELLNALADPCYIAYPNDTIQRHVMATHFCVGGELVRLLGWWAHPEVSHSVDVPLTVLGRLTGLLRYAPFVIFDHQHFVTGKAPQDATYGATYEQGANQPGTQMYKGDIAALDAYMAIGGQMHADARKIIAWTVFHSESESEEWAAQDRVDALKLGLPPDSASESPGSKGVIH
jgi:hypothetical protein